MRFGITSVTFLILLSACSLNKQVISPKPNRTSTTTANSTNVFVATKSAARTVPIETPQDINTISIQFTQNETFTDLADSLLAHQTKTYTLTAPKGQVMSVSVNQSLDGDLAYIEMQIAGRNGTILCQSVSIYDCEFWRGMLPSTQEYLIKLTPTIDVPGFTLRVAVDPPGTAAQSFQYTSLRQDANFTYQDDFAPARSPDYIPSRVKPEFALRFIDTSFYIHTNLGDVYVLFGSSNDTSIVANCTQPVVPGGMELVVGEVTINGVKFIREDGFDAATGTDSGRSAYRAIFNGYCYEMLFFYSYGNIGFYAPELGVKEFDREALEKRFEAILSTLVVK